MVDGFEVAALVGRLGHDAPAARLAELPALQEVFAQIHVRIRRDELGGILDLTLRERVPFGDEAANLLDEPRDRAGVVGLALDEQVVPLGANADVQQAFEVSQVVVVGPEDRGQAVLGDGNAASGDGSDRDISLCCKELTDLKQRSTPQAPGQASPLSPGS